LSLGLKWLIFLLFLPSYKKSDTFELPISKFLTSLYNLLDMSFVLRCIGTTKYQPPFFLRLALDEALKNGFMSNGPEVPILLIVIVFGPIENSNWSPYIFCRFLLVSIIISLIIFSETLCNRPSLLLSKLRISTRIPLGPPAIISFLQRTR